MGYRTTLLSSGAVSLCLLLAWCAAGCAKREAVPESLARPASLGPEADEAASSVSTVTHPVEIEAYLDKSDESQDRTVKLLQSLESAYGDRLTLTIHDISDGDEGRRAFEDAGLTTETIRINGSEYIEFERDGTKVTVAFRSPAGFRWTYADLVDALAAASTGTATPLTAEEAVRNLTRPELDVPIDVVEVDDSGKRAVALKIGDVETLRLPVGAGTGSPLKRALEAKKTLEAALGDEFTPSDVAAKQTGQSWVVTARGKTMLVITGQDAKALGSDPATLAREAVASIKKAVQEAVLPTESEMPPITGPPAPVMGGAT